MPHLALNAIRFFIGLAGFGIYFMFRMEKPTIDWKDNLKPVLLYWLILIFSPLTFYVPVVYIPLAVTQALYFCFAMISTICFMVMIDREKIHWTEVINH